MSTFVNMKTSSDGISHTKQNNCLFDKPVQMYFIFCTCTATCPHFTIITCAVNTT